MLGPGQAVGEGVHLRFQRPDDRRGRGQENQGLDIGWLGGERLVAGADPRRTRRAWRPLGGSRARVTGSRPGDRAGGGAAAPEASSPSREPKSSSPTRSLAAGCGLIRSDGMTNPASSPSRLSRREAVQAVGASAALALASSAVGLPCSAGATTPAVQPSGGAANGLWPNGARLAVSFSLMFEGGGQPISGAGGVIPDAIGKGVPDLPTNAFFAYGHY